MLEFKWIDYNLQRINILTIFKKFNTFCNLNQLTMSFHFFGHWAVTIGAAVGTVAADSWAVAVGAWIVVAGAGVVAAGVFYANLTCSSLLNLALALIWERFTGALEKV